MFDPDRLIGAVQGGVFEEYPVDVRTFVTDENYLNQVGITLSDYQYELIERASQIYKKEELIEMYGPIKGMHEYRKTVREVVAVWGKGSGKDYCSAIAIAYMVHKLMCLKDPAAYFGKPPGNSIDILNIAINAKQAKNVFFGNLYRLITNSKWFQNRYEPKIDSIHFEKNINAYSGHSEREGFEGYNTIAVILDEISGFAMDKPSTGDDEGEAKAKTAEGIYKMYKQSVSSRFGRHGKLILLSFPRHKGDFIFTRYRDVILECDTQVKQATLKYNTDLPDGIEENEMVIEWEEDNITSYRYSGVWATRRPTWVVNPTKRLDEDLADSFFDDLADSMCRFACMPGDTIDGYFRASEKIDAAVSSSINAITATGALDPSFKPDPKKRYFFHVDLAQKHDRCVVAVAHVDKWRQKEYGKGGLVETQPYVVVDAIKVWTPSKSKLVNFVEVQDFIEGLAKVFKPRLITFDRWNSITMIEYFNDQGYNSETLSVKNSHYDDFKLMVLDERVLIPYNEVLRTELKELRIVKNGKIDHPRGGSKDIADAVCGAAYNAAVHTPKGSGELEIVTSRNFEEYRQRQEHKPMINPPKARMPDEVKKFLAMRAI